MKSEQWKVEEGVKEHSGESIKGGEGQGRVRHMEGFKED